MRFRMGKGQVLVFDAYIEKRVEALRKERGFYPTLKEVGEKCVPPTSPAYVDRALRRLAAAGRLSKEAMQVYNAKSNTKNITGDAVHEKGNRKKTKK